MDYTVTREGDKCVITIVGPLKAADQGAYETLLADCAADGTPNCRIDLSRVDQIDSTGLGLLLMLRDGARKAGGSVVLTAPREAVRHAFHLARFDEIFVIE
jgi:anti-sigma B factor antagonist